VCLILDWFPKRCWWTMTSQICCLHHLTPLIIIIWNPFIAYFPSYKPPFIGDSRPAMVDDNSRQSPIAKVNSPFLG
jgi:hypothetical protein